MIIYVLVQLFLQQLLKACLTKCNVFGVKGHPATPGVSWEGKEEYWRSWGRFLVINLKDDWRGQPGVLPSAGTQDPGSSPLLRSVTEAQVSSAHFTRPARDPASAVRHFRTSKSGLVERLYHVGMLWM